MQLGKAKGAKSMKQNERDESDWNHVEQFGSDWMPR